MSIKQTNHLNKPFTKEENNHITANELWFHFNNLTPQEKIDEIFLDNLDDSIYEAQRHMGATDEDIIAMVQTELEIYHDNKNKRNVPHEDIAETITHITRLFEDTYNGMIGEPHVIKNMIDYLNDRQSKTVFYALRERKNYPQGARRIINHG